MGNITEHVVLAQNVYDEMQADIRIGERAQKELNHLREGLNTLVKDTENTFYTMDTVEYVRRELERLLDGGE